MGDREATREQRLDAWLRIMDQLSHYQVLNLPREAESEAIQAAFHAFSEIFHPDQHPKVGDLTRQKLRRVFQRGAEAYRVLRSPELRASYHLELATQNLKDDTAAASLEHLCQTPGGRLHARQAERALAEGQLAEAETLLQKALLSEGGNSLLQERLEALQAWRSLSTPT